MGAGPVALVFVHGGVHTGACWDTTIAAVGRVAPEVTCLAVDLPGRRDVPGDLATLTIEACVGSVVEQILAKTGADARIVLVGHSLAGVVLPGVADRLTDRVDHVVFVACCVPPQGKCVLDTLLFPLDRITRRVIRRAPVITRPPPGLVRFFFANGSTRSQREAIRASVCAESAAMLTEPRVAAVPREVRTSWVLPTRDRALRPATQRGFIHGLGIDRVVKIDAGHEVMITHPDELAAALVGLVFDGVSDGVVPVRSSDSDVDPVGGQARDRLVAAAAECIDRGDIGRVTVNALAAAAGVHRVTFYRHFPDKESLVVEVLERRAAPVLEHATRGLRADAFFPDGLVDAMAAAIAEVRTTPGLIAALGLHSDGDLSRPAGTSDRFLLRANEIVGPFLVVAREAGQLRGDVPVDEIVAWLVQVCLSNLLLNPDHSIEDTRRQLTRFIVPALRKD